MKNKEIKKLSIEIKEKLLAEVVNCDTEAAHANADDLLCEMLAGLGFQDIVDAYNKVEKWYA